MSKIRVVLLGLAIALGLSGNALYAQTDDAPNVTEPGLYDDGYLTFEYPDDWFVCEDCDPQGNTLAIGNTENAVEAQPDNMNEGDVQVLIMKRAQDYFNEVFGAEYTADTTPTEAIQRTFGLPSSDIEFVEFEDGRSLTYIQITNEDSNIELLIALVDMGDGAVAGLIAAGFPGAVVAVEDDVLMIASSFRLAAADTDDSVEADAMVGAVEDTESTGMLDSLTRDSSDEADNSLPETFTSEELNLSIRHPEGWVIVEDDNILFGASSQDALEVDDLADLQPGETAFILYPTVTDIDSYPNPMNDGTRPSTIVSFFASLGFTTGWMQNGPMQQPELSREASASFATNEADGVDRLVISIDDDQGDIVTMVAFGAIGELEALQPTLEAIIDSIEK